MRVKRVEYFIYLLIKTSKNQARALLETATTDQILGISEVFLNLIENNIPLSKKIQTILKKHKGLFQKLGSRKLPEKSKYKLVCKHWKLVWSLLTEAKKILHQLLS